MTWEIWYSNEQCSTTVFAQGCNNKETLEPDARLITTFEAETVEEIRTFKDSFLYSPGGFFDRLKAEQDAAANP